MFRLPHSLASFGYPALIIVSAISFWSSGVMLIRLLGSYAVWSSPGILLALVYVLSLPLIAVSVRGVEGLFVRLYKTDTDAVYHITGLVLIVHSLAITVFPTWYAFTLSAPLTATAWLLWFGGIIILFQSWKITRK